MLFKQIVCNHPVAMGRLFLRKCGRGDGLRTTTCLNTLVGISNGMLPVKYCCSTKPLFVFITFNGDHMTACKDEVKSGHPQWCLFDCVYIHTYIYLYVYTYFNDTRFIQKKVDKGSIS